MRKLILLFFVCTSFAAHAQISHGLAEKPNTEGYRLSTSAENPIPRDVFFTLWTDVALKGCAETPPWGQSNLSASECVQKINLKAPACTSKLSADAPARISDEATSRRLGKQFLACAVPIASTQ